MASIIATARSNLMKKQELVENEVEDDQQESSNEEEEESSNEEDESSSSEDEESEDEIDDIIQVEKMQKDVLKLRTDEPNVVWTGSYWLSLMYFMLGGNESTRIDQEKTALDNIIIIFIKKENTSFILAFLRTPTLGLIR